MEYQKHRQMEYHDREHYGCRYCGLCLFGCPYDSRYSAVNTLSELVRGGHAA